jgi:hypothetical protein
MTNKIVIICFLSALTSVNSEDIKGVDNDVQSFLLSSVGLMTSKSLYNQHVIRQMQKGNEHSC